jgi:hypothetical protein
VARTVTIDNICAASFSTGLPTHTTHCYAKRRRLRTNCAGQLPRVITAWDSHWSHRFQRKGLLGGNHLAGRFAISSETTETEAPEPVPAAQYVRMSTEHQRYSPENQSDAILQYAVRYGFDIVRTYADNGKSGLRIDGRNALKQLLVDVEGGTPGFKAVLVYDVSRWGRFQDADEGAYYEYICRRSGIEVLMTAASPRPSSRRSNARWPANTAASCRRKYSPVSAD